MKFGAGLVGATLAMIAAYIAFTRWVTEWRAKLQREMNEVDNKAIGRAVDSLLNYETVKYFGAEEREAKRYDEAVGAFASGRAQRGVARMAEHRPGADHQSDDRRRDDLHRLGLEPGPLHARATSCRQQPLMQLFRPLDMLGWVYRSIRERA